MSSEAIRAAVFHVLSSIAPEADPGSLAPGANLREELDLDSMDWLAFVQGIHRELGVEIAERDYGRLRTLEECLAWLERSAASTASPS